MSWVDDLSSLIPVGITFTSDDLGTTYINDSVNPYPYSHTFLPPPPPPGSFYRYLKDISYERYRGLRDAGLTHKTALESLGMQARNPVANPFESIKKSVREIEVDPISEESATKIQQKIDRLNALGATAQAIMLELELKTRQKLCHLKEWDYKLLPAEAIGKFNNDNQMTATKDSVKLYIDPLEKYSKFMPDAVLDKLEEAKERQLFDTFVVLSARKVPDPLLLGQINGCKDFFYIAEWGDDISFEQIMKGKQK